jgi:hypothetical protein
MPYFYTIAIIAIITIFLSASHGFTHTTKTIQARQRYAKNYFQQFQGQSDSSNTPSPTTNLREEAEILKAKAEKLRSEIDEITKQQPERSQPKENQSLQQVGIKSSPWIINSKDDDDEDEDDDGEQYRLYASIGREDGSWMDPRWAASGKRIDFALDIKLLPTLAGNEIADKMIRDNSMGKSSKVFALETAQFARLRDGFDRMECTNGAYRIDANKNNQYTIRFVMEVEGTIKADQSYIYGDVSIPKGYLYFSLPCFVGSIKQLSKKEGLVSVRQSGWHTGWRREESRICGVFTAKSILDAQRFDPY